MALAAKIDQISVAGKLSPNERQTKIQPAARMLNAVFVSPAAVQNGTSPGCLGAGRRLI
jgi:hypothetical protein